jgi:glucose-6-phosphate 1-dehydrogenase
LWIQIFSWTMTKSDNHILVIFGASGDLAYRKLVPALFDLFAQDLLPEKFAVLGASRSPFDDQHFRAKMKEGIVTFANHATEHKDRIDAFLPSLHYHALNTFEVSEYAGLKQRLKTLDREIGIGGNYLFYLSTPPNLYDVIPAHLAAHHLNRQGAGIGWKRLIIEKPFGTDLSSGKRLNLKLLGFFEEEQLYRIDHYLGKETVQNLLVTRFANGIYEPLWNRNYIHHIEITTAESIGVESRGGYYDHSGAMRDMVQNHLLQVAALVAMEPPTTIEASSIRNETMKVFQSLRPLGDHEVRKHVIRGQYTAARVRGKNVVGYRDEEGVDAESRTETYVAMKFFIDNWRWGGVPFYIRTGKALPTRVSEIVIHFKPTPHALFVDNKDFTNTGNILVIRIQPDEGILLKFGMKVPGAGFEVKNVNMDFRYADLQETYVPSAYERLLLDAMLGDATLYARGDAVEAAWTFVQPVLDFWKNDQDSLLYGYPAGSWGPEVADQLITEPELAWRYPCSNLSEDGVFCEL